MNTVKDLATIIGRQGRLRTAEGLRVDVRINDARKAYGRVDYHVSPLAGDGGVWVASDRVKVGAQR